jgi:hypothetical protein
MLKKTGHILIILLLLFGTTGLTITRHFCGKNLIHTSIYSSPNNCCKGNCPGCHNEKINFRITDQFESYQTQIDFTAGFKTLLEQHSLPTILAFSSSLNLALLNDAPGDHGIKPSPTKPICAGNTTAILQVFLF